MSFKCVVCDKIFANKSSLTTHQPTHSGFKIYQCDVCKTSFLGREHFKSMQSFTLIINNLNVNIVKSVLLENPTSKIQTADASI